MNKIDRELEKAREKAAEWPGAGKAETGGRKQPDRAGCPLLEADTRRADSVLKRPGKPFCRFGSKWPEAGNIHKGGQRP